MGKVRLIIKLLHVHLVMGCNWLQGDQLFYHKFQLIFSYVAKMANWKAFSLVMPLSSDGMKPDGLLL